MRILLVVLLALVLPVIWMFSRPAGVIMTIIVIGAVHMLIAERYERNKGNRD